MTRLDDGSITVDEATFQEERFIPSGVSFETIKVARMYRHSTGYIPLYHGKFGEKLEIWLEGDARADIDVRVSHPTYERGVHLTERIRPAGTPPEPVVNRFDRMTPGQITIVAWRPAADHQTSRTIDLPASPDSDSM